MAAYLVKRRSAASALNCRIVAKGHMPGLQSHRCKRQAHTGNERQACSVKGGSSSSSSSGSGSSSKEANPAREVECRILHDDALDRSAGYFFAKPYFFRS